MERKEVVNILLQVFEAFDPELQRQTLNATASSGICGYQQEIDRMVENETKRFKGNYLLKEQQYVEEMILENPITIDRRINSTAASSSGITNHHHSDKDVDVESISPPKKPNTFLQHKRAEECRLSQIQKAKLKYSHKFISQKVLDNTNLFEFIQDVIERAENHLVTEGLTKGRLRHLRQSFGVDIAANKVRRWKHLMKMES